ncbi:uncharacterized protein F5891DRAFT_979319 [Suillus fuscotomentosus]|uniref:Uncharacterized protein n=1 Tax=Suillus fuscotomentosus TaxID=1912939 RepID=A0AAD4E8W7_9AGAM|nr:uncharacterized protein F5891DRAFT_979319 [Suillus fuscotomentosus]KAG1901839.1 hypothetical protein F5891DRAFT_979319 [Suillus fuscotomentosus]
MFPAAGRARLLFVLLFQLWEPWGLSLLCRLEPLLGCFLCKGKILVGVQLALGCILTTFPPDFTLLPVAVALGAWSMVPVLMLEVFVEFSTSGLRGGGVGSYFQQLK